MLRVTRVPAAQRGGPDPAAGRTCVPTARKRRGQWLAIALFAFVIIIFVLTMNKVGGGMGLPQVYNMQGTQ